MSSTIPESKSYEFKAEIRQLLDILIHSVYTSKDIFLRELVSNAADALEKVRFAKVQGKAIHEPDRELEIRIETRKAEGDRGAALVISDTGIGMTEEEIRTNLGTIAHSGASAFLASLEAGAAKDVHLIGKFGVGFYSVFMVAEKVIIRSRAAEPGARPVQWTSEGAGSYSVEDADEDLPRGTSIEIRLRKGEERFAEASTIKAAIRRYSNFVAFPVRVDGEAANRVTALWREPPGQIKDEQYNEFYEFIHHDDSEPLARLHVSVDLPIQFAALLFVPETNLELLGFGEGKVAVQLYVKRVLIDAENENLLPKYLRFVKGVVESEDLPLNVSRETLQENSIVVKIRDVLARKTLDLLIDIAKKDREKYEKIWRAFGRIIEEGYADFPNRERFQELLRFNASTHPDDTGLMGLDEYVAAFAPGQKAIYYLSGANRAAITRDPRLEIFRKKRIPVLCLYAPADEFVLSTIGKYKDCDLVSAEHVRPSDLADVGEADGAGSKSDEASSDAKDSTRETSEVDIEPLLERFRHVLGDRVAKVAKSERLVDSPVCLVSSDEHVSSHMDRILRSIHRESEAPRRILEVHPRHPLVLSLVNVLKSGEDVAFIDRTCEQLFDSALLLDGLLTDPHQFVARMHSLLAEAAKVRSGSS
jgi:molecular chaperone HtpG